MITRRKLRRGEGECVDGDPKVGSRRRTARGEEMVQEGGGGHPFKSKPCFVDA